MTCINPHSTRLAVRRSIMVVFSPMSDEPVVEFIPAEAYQEEAAEDTERVYKDDQPYSEIADECRELSTLATSGNGVSRISVPRELKRQRVVNAFQDAFELIGGVPRLAHWADQSPSAFYKLYARLLPTTAQQQLEHSGEILVKHVLPRGPLDGDDDASKD